MAHQSGRNDFDAVCASAMVEAQQTAAPLASKLGKTVDIFNGVQALNAGWYNGKPESMAARTYMLAPVNWIEGDVGNSIPGSISGKQFNDQFTAAVNKVYTSGNSKPVVGLPGRRDHDVDPDGRQERQGKPDDQIIPCPTSAAWW